MRVSIACFLLAVALSAVDVVCVGIPAFVGSMGGASGGHTGIVGGAGVGFAGQFVRLVGVRPCLSLSSA